MPALDDDARVMTPAQAAERLQCSTHVLTRIVMTQGYAYTSLGGRPGDRGRNRWGLTPPQFRAILAGQAKRLELPSTRSARAPREVVSAPTYRRMTDAEHEAVVRLLGRKTADRYRVELNL